MLEPFCATSVAQHTAQRRVEQVGRGMQARALGAAVRQTALEALLGARVAALLVLGEVLFKARLVHGQARSSLASSWVISIGEAVGRVQVEGHHAVDDLAPRP